MNTTLRTLAAAVIAAACAAPAFATDDNHLFPEADARSSLTRAEVRAEYLRARADGKLPANSEQRVFAFEGQPAVKTASGLSREQVKAELAQARAEGTLVSFEQLPYDKQWPGVSTRSREEVRAEARFASRQPTGSRQGL